MRLYALDSALGPEGPAFQQPQGTEKASQQPLDHAMYPLLTPRHTSPPSDLNMSLTAVVLGSTGAVGSAVVSALASNPSWSTIYVVVRSAPSTPHPSPKVKPIVVPMPSAGCSADDLLALTSTLKPQLPSQSSATFCLIGVGAPSKGSGSNLLHVDVDLSSALIAAAPAKHLSLLTAIDAARGVKKPMQSKISPLPFARAGGPLYNFCKGAIETACLALPFSSRSFFQPATLLGTPNTPSSWAWLAPKLDWMLPPAYKSSDIHVLSRSMVKDAEQKVAAPGADGGDKVFEGKELHALYAEVKE